MFLKFQKLFYTKNFFNEKYEIFVNNSFIRFLKPSIVFIKLINLLFTFNYFVITVRYIYIESINLKLTK